MALTSDQQTQLQGIKEKALNLKGVIDERVRNERAGRSSGGGSGGITSDSGDATNGEKTVGKDIEDLTNRSGLGDEPDTDGLEDLLADQQAAIERRQVQLEARRNKAVAGIEEGFGVEKAATEFQQKRETGQTSVDLARAGGFLGVTASQKGVLQNLVVSQRAELRALESAKRDSINKANQAYEDRDFELAQESLKSAREIESEIFNRKNVFFGQQMDIMGEERAQMQNQRESTQFLRDQSNERLDRILDGGIVPDADDISEIATGLNISIDEANKLVKSGQEAKTLAEKDQKTERELAILNTLRGIPRDKTVVIDGVTYTGLASLPQASGASASAIKAQRQAEQQSAFAQQVRGFYGGRDDNEILSLPIEQAITDFPALDTDYIEDVYKIIGESENKKLVADKIASGEWDVANVNYGGTGGPQQVIYNKPAYEQAVKAWSNQATTLDPGFWNSKKDKAAQSDLEMKQATVLVNGEFLTGDGVWDEASKSYQAPVQPDDFEVNEFQK